MRCGAYCGPAGASRFWSTEVYFSLSTGVGFTRPRPWIDAFGAVGEGWQPDKHLRTLADVDGDGRADLVGFGNSGVQVWPADFCFAGAEQ